MPSRILDQSTDMPDYISLLRTSINASTSGAQVSNSYLSVAVVFLLILGAAGFFYINSFSRAHLGTLLASLGVHAKKLGRTAKEIERKTFHLFGLLVPLTYQLLLGLGFSQLQCTQLCWGLTAFTWAVDLMRLYLPVVRDNWPLADILREKEHTQLTGSCYLSLGSTLAINLFSPAVACASICFLVVGDMSAALIGVAYGGETCVVKLGREGKKSMEGSVAMFLSCFVIGHMMFIQVQLSEYAVFIGAAVATIVELVEPFGVNDNLSIPVLSGLALHWGLGRLEHCTSIAAGL